MEPSASRSPVILLVDDNPHDVVLTRLALRRAGVIAAIQLVKDGAEAMQYLDGKGKYADRQLYPTPTLLLLDLNMPEASGFEVLRWVKAQPLQNRLHVVVMSNSRATQDIEQAYALGANAYFVKPTQLSDLVGMMKCITESCLNTAEGRTGFVNPGRPPLGGAPLGSNAGLAHPSGCVSARA